MSILSEIFMEKDDCVTSGDDNRNCEALSQMTGLKWETVLDASKEKRYITRCGSRQESKEIAIAINSEVYGQDRADNQFPTFVDMFSYNFNLVVETISTGRIPADPMIGIREDSFKNIPAENFNPEKIKGAVSEIKNRLTQEDDTNRKRSLSSKLSYGIN